MESMLRESLAPVIDRLVDDSEVGRSALVDGVARDRSRHRRRLVDGDDGEHGHARARASGALWGELAALARSRAR